MVISELKAVAEILNFKIMHIYLMHATVTTPAGELPQYPTSAACVTHMCLSHGKRASCTLTPPPLCTCLLYRAAGVTGLTGAQAASMQFQHHMRAYDSAVGDKALGWQHWAWVGRQHIIAGELLVQNLPRPGPESRPQHIPAHYFHSAALYAIRRRKAATAAGLIGSAAAEGMPPQPTPAALSAATEAAKSTLLPSAFIGARPRVSLLAPTAPAAVEGGSGAVTTDAGASMLAALTAHYRLQESQFSHDEAIATLLDKAQSTMPLDGGGGIGAAARLLQRRSADDTSALLTSTSSRGRCWRSWLLAEELLASGRAADAAALYGPLADVMKRHGWLPLASRALLRLRECASVLRDDALTVTSSLELLQPAMASNAVRPTALFDDVAQAAARLSTMGRKAVVQIDAPPPVVPVVAQAATPSSTATDASVTTVAARPLPLSRRRPVAQRAISSPLPAQLSPALTSAPSAPLLSVLVAFSARAVVRGAQVTVRVAVASAFPAALRLDRLDLTFATVTGDVSQVLNATGAGVTGIVNSAVVGGVPGGHLGPPSPFDLTLVDDALAVSVMTTPASVSEPNMHGVRRITFTDDYMGVDADDDDGENVGGDAAVSGPRDNTPRSRFNSTGSLLVHPTDFGSSTTLSAASAAPPVRCPLVIPARGVFAFEYVVRVPVTHGALSRSPRSTGVDSKKASKTSSGSMHFAAPTLSLANASAVVVPDTHGVHEGGGAASNALRGRSNSLAARHADVSSLLVAMASTPSFDVADAVCSAMLRPTPMMASAGEPESAATTADARSVDWTCSDASTMASVLHATLPPGIAQHSRVINGETVVVGPSIGGPVSTAAASMPPGAAAAQPIEAALAESMSCVSVRAAWSGRSPSTELAGGSSSGSSNAGTDGIVFTITPAKLRGSVTGAAAATRVSSDVRGSTSGPLPPLVAAVGRVGVLRAPNQVRGFVPALGGEDDEDADRRRKKAAAAAAAAAAVAAAAREARRSRVCAALQSLGFLSESSLSTISVDPSEMDSGGAASPIAKAPSGLPVSPSQRFVGDLLVSMPSSTARVHVTSAAVDAGAGVTAPSRLPLISGCFEPLRLTIHSGMTPLAGGVVVLSMHTATPTHGKALAEGDDGPESSAFLTDIALPSLAISEGTGVTAVAQGPLHGGRANDHSAATDMSSSTTNQSSPRSPDGTPLKLRSPTLAPSSHGGALSSATTRVYVTAATLVMRGDGTVTAAGAAGSHGFVCVDGSGHQHHAGDKVSAAVVARSIVGVAVPPLPAGAEFSVTVFVRGQPLALPTVPYDATATGSACALALRAAVPRVHGAFSVHLHCAIDASGESSAHGGEGAYAAPSTWVPRVLRRPHDYRQVVSHTAVDFTSPIAASLVVLPHATVPTIDCAALAAPPLGAAAPPSSLPFTSSASAPPASVAATAMPTAPLARSSSEHGGSTPHTIGTASVNTRATVMLRLHAIAPRPVALTSVSVTDTAAHGLRLVTSPSDLSANVFGVTGGSAALLQPGDAATVPLSFDCISRGLWSLGRLHVSWGAMNAVSGSFCPPTHVGTALAAPVESPRLRLPSLSVATPPVSARVLAYPSVAIVGRGRPAGSQASAPQPIAITLRNGSAHAQLLEAELALDSAGLPDGADGRPAYFELVSAMSPPAPSTTSTVVVVELLPGAEKTVAWLVRAPHAAAAKAGAVAALPIVRVRALEPAPTVAPLHSMLTLHTGAVRAAITPDPPADAATSARPLAPALLLLGVARGEAGGGPPRRLTIPVL